MIALAVVLLILAALIDRGSCSNGNGDNSAPAGATSATDSASSSLPPSGRSGSPGQQSPGRTAPSPAPPAKTTTPAAPPPVAATSAGGVPAVVGLDLQKARDAVWYAGYHFIKPHDALGRGRMQLMLSNWQVCDQNPGPGKIDKDTTVRLGVVRKDEDCPAAPLPTAKPSAPDGITPNVLGRSVNVVREALRGEVKVDADDLKSGRAIIIENHWQVCTQNPAPGAPLPKDKIKLGVVKFGEDCP